MSQRDYTQEELTDLDILQKATLKAIEHGWQESLREDKWHIHPGRMPGRYDFCYPKVDQSVYHIDYSSIIFDHGFAKALWHRPPYGLDPVINDDWVEPWKVRLQEMVVEENPIKYLGEHLDVK